MKRSLSFYDQVLALTGPTSVDLKKYTRAELLEIILMQSREIDNLRKQAKELQAQMDDKRVVLAEAGSIAEASLALTAVFEEAEKAVAIYKENVKRLSDNQFAYMNQVSEEVTRQAEGILAEADLQGELSRLRNNAMSASEPSGFSNLSNLSTPLEQKVSQQPQGGGSSLGQYQHNAQQSALQGTQQGARNGEFLSAVSSAYQTQPQPQQQQPQPQQQLTPAQLAPAALAALTRTQPLAAPASASASATQPLAASASATQPLAASASASTPAALAALTQPSPARTQGMW